MLYHSNLKLKYQCEKQYFTHIRMYVQNICKESDTCSANNYKFKNI